MPCNHAWSFAVGFIVILSLLVNDSQFEEHFFVVSG